MRNRKYRQCFIKLQENQAYYGFELEVIESEDCTNNLEELVGHINMMDTKYGNLTGATPHLMKEKSEILEEARKFHKKSTIMGAQMVTPHFEQGLENYSMILPPGDNGFGMRKDRSMTRFANHSAIHVQNGAFDGSMMGHFNANSNINNNPQAMQRMRTSAHPTHMRMSSNIPPSNLVQSMNFIPDNSHMGRPSQFQPNLNNTYNMGNTNNLVKSTVFHDGNPRLSMIRRPTIMDRRTNLRQSVMQTYQKLATMHKAVNRSVNYSQMNNSMNMKNVSIYTDNNTISNNSKM